MAPKGVLFVDPSDYDYLASLPESFPRPRTSRRQQFDRLLRAKYIRRRWFDDSYELTAKATDEMQLYRQRLEYQKKQQAKQQRVADQQRSRHAADLAQQQAQQRREAAKKTALDVLKAVLLKLLLK